MKTELNKNTDHLALSFLLLEQNVHRFPLCFVKFVYSLLKKIMVFINSFDSSGWKLEALGLHR